ncbi:MAG: GtrA family protein [Eubacteriales bacterium]|nr:GtrA family protein [Eubacteriales bacterium]
MQTSADLCYTFAMGYCKNGLWKSAREDSRLLMQALRYGVAAFGGFAADYCALLMLKEWGGLHYLIAVPIAFVVGLAVNYAIGIGFVFQRSKMALHHELALFLAVSLLALAVTEASMFLLTGILRVDYRISRVFSGGITFLFNFFSRRWLLYRLPKNTDVEEAQKRPV